MAGLSSAYMMPVVTPVLLASPLRSGSGGISLRTRVWRALPAILAPTVGPLRRLGPIGPLASPATRIPAAVWVSKGPLLKGPPLHDTVVGLGPPLRVPSLGREGGTWWPGVLGLPVVATPMEG